MIHIMPTNDLKEHTEETTCDCEPELIIEKDSEIICVHNAYDKREFIEMVNEQLE